MAAAPLRLDEIITKALVGDPQTKAIECEGQSYTWGWIREGGERLKALLVQTGVPQDAPIAFIPRQLPEAAAAFLGMVSARRSMVMIYSYQSVDAMAKDVAKLRTAAVVAHAQDWEAPLIEACREIGAVGISLALDGGVSIVDGLDTVGPGEHHAPLAEPGVELLTSGTTGPPKRHGVAFEAMRRCMLDSSFQLGDGKGDARPSVITVPIANISGIYGFIFATAMRKPVILEKKFNLARWHEHVKTWKPMNIGGPPAIVKMILDADIPKEDLASAKFMTIGMGAVDPVVRRNFEAKYDIPILPCYGATEFVGAAAAMTLDDHHRYGEAKFGSVGRAVKNVEFRLVDQETGQVIPNGSGVGILEVLHHDIGESWIHTTDLAEVDEDGFLFLRGRADGVINRGGFKIHPGTIESVILQHPLVAAASVVGIPHERLGTVPVAAVEPHAGGPAPSPAELEAFLRKSLPATNIPIEFVIVDTLPRTPSMKIRLDAVRALFAKETVG